MNQDMLAKVRDGRGFIAALDQSGGSTPGALKAYGVGEDAYADEAGMFERIHEKRVRIVTSPAFTGDKVLGAILFEKTMDGVADGQPVPAYLWSKGIVPFLKMDKGLEAEADGVKLMKPIGGLDELLQRAVGLGVFGTKMRSVVERADRGGIARVVAQQFEVADQIAAHGLMPIIEPEVSIKSPERAECDALLRDEIARALDALPTDRQVMLKLTLPAEPDLFAPLVDHPRVLRVVALSGGFPRPEACAHLMQNRGLIASFSRALLEDLRFSMSDEEFDAALGAAVEEIYRASVDKA